jgi:hypothetical protein
MRVTVETQDETGITRMSVETGGPLLQPDAVEAYATSLSNSLLHLIGEEMGGDDEPPGFFIPKN